MTFVAMQDYVTGWIWFWTNDWGHVLTSGINLLQFNPLYEFDHN